MIHTHGMSSVGGINVPTSATRPHALIVTYKANEKGASLKVDLMCVLVPRPFRASEQQPFAR